MDNGSGEVEQVGTQAPDFSVSDWRQLCLGVLLLLMSAGAWVWLLLHGGVPDLPVPEKNKTQAEDGDQAGAQSDAAAQMPKSSPAGQPEPTDDLLSDTDAAPEPRSSNSNRVDPPPRHAQSSAAGTMAVSLHNTRVLPVSGDCLGPFLVFFLTFVCCPWLDWLQNSIERSGPLPRYDRKVHHKGHVISRRSKKTFSCCSNTKIASLTAVEPDTTKVR